MPKILFIAYKYDYGKLELGLSPEYYIFYDTFKKMNNKENEVIYFPIDEITARIGYSKMNQKLLEVVEKEKPNICFFVFFKSFLEKEVIRKITEKDNITTINWFTDDHWAFDNFSKHWVFLFDWAVTTDLDSVPRYKKMGYKNIIRSQWAFNSFLCKPLNLPKIYDVSFIGQPYGNRRQVIKKLEKAGIKVNCFGSGWSEGKVSFKKMVEIFSQTKINLNFSNSSVKISPKYIAKIFLKKRIDKLIQVDNPKNWIGNIKSLFAGKKEQIKDRNFGIPACGSFLLTNYMEDLEEYYEIGKEIVCFKNTEELIHKIKYYLRHNEEREVIAMAGYKRAVRDHSYEKRFNEIFKIINV